MTRFKPLAALLALCCGAPCYADLQPEQIAVVAARGNRESVGLARYYCRQRGVPEDQIIEIDVPGEEALQREKWRWAVRTEIREWLEANDPDRELRCLVTTWGVPLKIAAAKPDESYKAYREYLDRERTSRLERLDQLALALDQLAGGTPLAEAVAAMPGEAGEDESELKKSQRRLEGALKAAQRRIAGLPPGERRPHEARLQQFAAAAGGARVLLQGIGQQIQAQQAAGNEVPPQVQQQFNLMRGRAGAFTELRYQLDSRPPGFDRDELMLRLLEQTGGLLATIEWLDDQVVVARRNQTGSSFDSELSLVLWPDGYELLRWQPNYLRGSYDTSELREAFPTLMVSRLDGPDLRTAKRLIDDALAVEQAGGLKGKAYLDARGLTELEGPPLEPGSYPDFDRALLVTAKGLEDLKNDAGDPRFEVVLNKQPELFMPGQCPDAGLYCGWYSLAKYVDAFDWNQGAVAYHLASAEARTLRELDSQVWCKKLLEDGVCVTIGPVYEPYLIAFPRPNEFFALLIRGELPLVEVYYRTKPFNSWVMTLIGDPLYRPFSNEAVAPNP